MADLEQRLSAAQQRITAATSRKARAEVERDNAKESLAATRKTLADEFGIKTNEDVKRVRAELEAEVEEAMATVESALEEAGA